jgi:hypothetical protein
VAHDPIGPGRNHAPAAFNLNRRRRECVLFEHQENDVVSRGDLTIKLSYEQAETLADLLEPFRKHAGQSMNWMRALS